MRTSKTHLYSVLTGVFVACLLISNVMSAKTFTLGNVVLPCAVVLFPIVYIVNDVMAEIYGFRKARNIIFLGFAMNALAVVAYAIAIALPAPAYAAEGAAAFAVTLGSTWRILAASFAAYLVGSLVNAGIMVRMKERLRKYLMLRCVLSTLIGEGIDAAIFITIAFIGTMPLDTLLVMIAAQAAFKTLFEIAFYPLTRVVIKKVEKLPV
jgi:uncharacterized integral membrane protein (TIGR00697 family)